MKAINRVITTLFLGVISINAFTQSEFSEDFISIGVVVEDIEESLSFYTDIIGMMETGGFTVNAEMGGKTGLTGGVGFDVKVLKLVDSPNATEWKLLSFNRGATHPDQKHIQDDTGMQYITIFVNDLRPFIQRLEKNKITLLGETPTALNGGRHFVLVQDPDGVFIELIGPMK